MNLQNNFSGLVVQSKNVWEHFGLEHLWEGLANPRTLVPVEFFATLASDDAWDVYRRAANALSYLLFLGPLLTAGKVRSEENPAPAARTDDRGHGALSPWLCGGKR